MASGVAIREELSDGSSFVKFSSGFMMARGTVNVTSSTAGGRFGGYRGHTYVDLSAFGFVSLIAAFSNIPKNAAYWNTAAVQLNETDKSVRVTISGNANATSSVQWVVFGTWR